MRDGNSKKSKLSWSKSLFRKWFNLKGKAQDFHADDVVRRGGSGEWRNSFTERSLSSVRRSKTERLSKMNTDRYQRGKIDCDVSEVTETQEYRIFAATWNVGGKSPPSYLNLEDWLHTSPPADIYVLGFQEIVPLNAGNVLGAEDNGPAKKWVALIRKTLNNLPGTSSSSSYQTPSPVPDPIVELDDDFEGSSSSHQRNSSFFHRRSFQSLSRSLRMDGDILAPQPRLDRRHSVCERVMFGSRPSDFEPNFRWGNGSSDEENVIGDSPTTAYFSPMSYGYGASSSMEERDASIGFSRYCLVASKQMVGILLMVWVRSEIRDEVKNIKVSCVGRGLMGYLGNKGSIAISMSLHQTSFCFVCSHLTSGQKEGDELRRNSDVMEITRKTRFPRVNRIDDEKSPESILEHDRIIWLGDLNYRIALSYRSAKALVEMHNWKALLEKDQLRIEQKCGRVFDGWSEGRIYFPPTYKYSNNSDRYAGDELHSKEKRRTPAWCDRILWYGRGLNQLSYVRGESKFSDHRPVYSIFVAEVESINHSRIKNMSFPSSRVEIEELLPYSHGYAELGFF
ncbi:type I inositol polyphosphate 5-phosphatase 4-like isoform X1 [Phalaenopsis equestris]|uniref:type I inositol polyphosphate 5-phosphatase 4-like isoform X1 n=1 Tax=Phalaenopsis equestris TaxID=78828 RepID=UPI0009E2F033|nr:type I inositol polyphosphate 5-phosphatase 4-like isoform X1 [Phalaenopsis equestris]XP_020584001.1 type I inositol polyphosphate 5-phosphatase 4-like isoform X1 [Phalaenopsis equestris]XP_020584009.1 type I inositol polyphosphate 5-phosphatase 4-like isoform X1 [Phalaenopsis equestris]